MKICISLFGTIIMSDEEDNRNFIHNSIEGLRHSLAFFSNKKKSQREIWVVNELLNHLCVKYEDEEVRASKEEPPDVLFRSANFEVKEILDNGRKRTEEIKEALKRTEVATDPQDLIEHYTPKSMSVDKVYLIILENAQKWMAKYANEGFRRTLDMVFYLNLQDHGITNWEFPRNVKILQEQGWRSVSVLTNECACVLCALEDAPEFLMSNVGKILRTRHKK